MAIVDRILGRFKANVGGATAAPPDAVTPDNVQRRPVEQPVQRADQAQASQKTIAQPLQAQTPATDRPKVLKPLEGDSFRSPVSWGQPVEKKEWKPTTPAASAAPVIKTETTSNKPSPDGTAAQSKESQGSDIDKESQAAEKSGVTQDELDAAKEVHSYNELLQELKARAAQRPLSPEDEKRKKRDKLIGGIGDALASVANLYYTTQGAPNMYDPKRSLSEAAKTKWDEIAENNEKIGKERLAYMIKQYELLKGKRKEKEAKEAADAKLELLKEQMEGKMGLDEKKLAAAMDYQKGRLANEKERNDNNKERNSVNKELSQARLEEQKRHNRIAEGQGATRNAIARQNANTRAANGGSGGGDYEWQDSEGNIHYARSATAQERNARANGTWKNGSTTTQSEETQKNYNEKSTTTTKTENKGYAVVDRSKVPQKKTHQAQAKKTSGSSGKKNKPLSGFKI